MAPLSCSKVISADGTPWPVAEETTRPSNVPAWAGASRLELARLSWIGAPTGGEESSARVGGAAFGATVGLDPSPTMAARRVGLHSSSAAPNRRNASKKK